MSSADCERKKRKKRGGFPKEGRPSVVADRPMGSCGNRAIKGQAVAVNSICQAGLSPVCTVRPGVPPQG